MNHKEKLTKQIVRDMTVTTIRNRDLTRKALNYLQVGKIDPHDFGKMIDDHHLLLKDGLKRSTEKIEKMISAAKDAGALGCKMNGSGGGGTMLAYAPGKEEEVADALTKAGGKPYIVNISNGASISY